MQISVMLEGQSGLNWDLWREVVAHADGWGLGGLYTSDHFVSPSPPNTDALEMIVAQSYTAAHTQRVTFGPIVAPVTFRDPALLARQAAALDVLSGGRMILGVGAGWMQREHNMFNYLLGDVATRMARFAEGLQVVHSLLRADAPVNFQGNYFTLRDAQIKPNNGTTRILVGGNGKQRTLRLAAKYADVWNGVHLSPAEFQERSNLLDTYLTAEGRDPAAVKRSLATPGFIGTTPAELEASLTTLRRWEDEYQSLSVDELAARLRANHMVGGYPEEIMAQVRAYAAAGVQELVLQWVNPADVAGLYTLAREILTQAA